MSIVEKMTDAEIKEYTNSLEVLFRCGIYKQNNYRELKERAEKVLKHEIIKTSFPNTSKVIQKIGKNGLHEVLFILYLKRILIGIACELIVKAAFLQSGYIINERLDKKKRLDKFGTVSEAELDPSRTYNFGFLIKEMYSLFSSEEKELYNAHVRKGLEIARIWRNKEVHVGGGYHIESMQDENDILISLIKIYEIIFDDKETLSSIFDI